jgi:hypothetical protein
VDSHALAGTPPALRRCLRLLGVRLRTGEHLLYVKTERDPLRSATGLVIDGFFAL